LKETRKKRNKYTKLLDTYRFSVKTELILNITSYAKKKRKNTNEKAQTKKKEKKEKKERDTRRKGRLFS